MPPHQPCTVYVTQSITSHLPSCKLFLDTSCVSCFQPKYNSFSKVPRCTQISWLNWGPSSPFAWTTWDRVGGSGWSLLNVPMLIECCHQFGVISRALRLISCGSKTPVEISTTKTTCRLTLAHILCKLAEQSIPHICVHPQTTIWLCNLVYRGQKGGLEKRHVNQRLWVHGYALNNDIIFRQLDYLSSTARVRLACHLGSKRVTEKGG